MTWVVVLLLLVGVAAALRHAAIYLQSTNARTIIPLEPPYDQDREDDDSGSGS